MKGKTMIRTLALVAFFLIVTGSNAQDSTLFNGTKHRFGAVAGFGGQLVFHIPYNYDVVFIQAEYYYAFLRKKIWGLDLIVQPQYNRSHCYCTDDENLRFTGNEFGLNAGILFRINALKDLLSFYAFVSSGPHYSTLTPERQSEGFLFSDNFFIGFNVRLFRNFNFDLRSGFRHMSSAGLTEPNGGVNNFSVEAGFMVNLIPGK